MQNDNNPIFYKGFLKRNLTENPAHLLICARGGKLEPVKNTTMFNRFIYLRVLWQT
jgi:hypothetical protein